MPKKKSNGNRPATHRDLEVWGGRLVEMIQERATEKELAAVKAQMATKKDLQALRKEFIQKFSTKEDLKMFATKEDLKQFATKLDFKRFAAKMERMFTQGFDALMKKMDVLVENRLDDLVGGKRDEVSLIKDKTEQLDHRVTVLERHSGL